MVTCSKEEAAIRQLDEAITMLFANRDPLAIRTLAGAASRVLADLVEKIHPKCSWREMIVKDSGLTKKGAYAVLDRVQNYLKHADEDPGAYLSFDEEENEHIIFIATLECGELEQRLSLSMEVFQLWYVASYPERFGIDTKLVKTSRSLFPSLNTFDRRSRLLKAVEKVDQLRP
ncbi:hypothetical protein L1889_00590 [Paenalcaligenes niemegkensis]|uniref:hypothetical protein n=1 Tax=Paenalcaligenes niemegkensis TaxID=2895469 RepID=UPI001EE783F2|nr:hypothetical protein [Paenalcaligenes niemegkensis]MCQ9615401.1 hypothetical protein [Paenalcaligenes niemegkensis]